MLQFIFALMLPLISFAASGSMHSHYLPLKVEDFGLFFNLFSRELDFYVVRVHNWSK